MAGPEATLLQELREQRRSLELLRRGLSDCQEAGEAMRACLEGRGLMSPAQFLAQLHRRRFEAVRRTHSLGSCVQLASVLEVQGLAMLTGRFLGPTSLEAACLPCRALAAALREVLRTVRCRYALRLLVCGGGDLEQPLGAVEQLCPGGGHWEALPSMAQRRWAAAAGVLGEELYVCGGGDGTHPLRSVERFSPRRNAWEYVEPMRVARFGPTAMASGGSLYVCGGEGSEEEPLDAVESFNPALGVWWSQPPLHQSRSAVAGAALRGVLYVCGGLDHFERPLASVERLDPRGGFWHFAPPMGRARSSAAVAASGPRLWACGGKAGEEERLCSVECFNADVGAWEALAPMAAPRSGAAAAAYRGRCYVFGGYDGTSSLKSAEVFDHARGQWVELPTMLESRWATAAVALLQL